MRSPSGERSRIIANSARLRSGPYSLTRISSIVIAVLPNKRSTTCSLFAFYAYWSVHFNSVFRDADVSSKPIDSSSAKYERSAKDGYCLLKPDPEGGSLLPGSCRYRTSSATHHCGPVRGCYETLPAELLILSCRCFMLADGLSSQWGRASENRHRAHWRFNCSKQPHTATLLLRTHHLAECPRNRNRELIPRTSTRPIRACGYLIAGILSNDPLREGRPLVANAEDNGGNSVSQAAARGVK